VLNILTFIVARGQLSMRENRDSICGLGCFKHHRSRDTGAIALQSNVLSKLSSNFRILHDVPFGIRTPVSQSCMHAFIHSGSVQDVCWWR